MSTIEIKITSVTGSGNEMMEADLVSFEVTKGEPSWDEVSQLIEANSVSVCNIEYKEADQCGSFVDMNFQFSRDQILSSE
mgnify:CR=1 FL=1